MEAPSETVFDATTQSTAKDTEDGEQTWWRLRNIVKTSDSEVGHRSDFDLGPAALQSKPRPELVTYPNPESPSI